MEILGNPPEDILLRELIYGESGRKKSWWAGAAANAGFNVLIINGDKPASIYRLLPEAAQKRLRIINVYGQYNYADLVARLLRGDEVWWDITESRRALFGMQNATHAHFVLDFNKLTKNEVVVFDSWTALAISTTHKLAGEKKIDLSEVGKIEWDLYGPSGMHLNWILDRIKKLQSHVILIGHEDTWEKMKKGSDGKLTQQIEFTKKQPISSSRPHAATMPKFFTDTLYFYMLGNQFYIDCSATSERAGGSTSVEPKNYKWDDLQFKDICKSAGVIFPPTDLPPPAACQYLEPGSLTKQPQTSTPTAAPILQGQAQGKVTLAALAKKG